MQSWEWGDFQEKLGNKVFRISEDDIFALVIKKKLPFGKNYLYFPRGPVFHSDFSRQSLEKFLEDAKNIVIDKKTIFLRIEPIISVDGKEKDETKDILKSMGFAKIESVQPGKTLIMDLQKNKEDILGEMEHNTRYAIKTAQKRGVKISVFEDQPSKESGFHDFWRIFAETNKRHNLKIYQEDYYRLVAGLSGDCLSELILAEAERRIIAGAITVFFDKTAYYLYAASASGYSRLNAPSLVLWEAILGAKKAGCQKFDLWGISETDKKWQGLTAFKKSFGGSEENYVGTWDIPLDKKFYLAYKALKKIIKK